MGKENIHTDFFASRPAAMDHAHWGRGVHMRKTNAEASANLVFQKAIEAGKATLWYGAAGACRIIGDPRAGTANRGVIHHHGHCYDGWWNLDGSRTVPPQPVPKRRRGPGPRGPLKHHHPAGPRKHRDPERARARARAASGRAAARPHHSKWSPRDVAAAIADEVGRNEQKT